MFFVIYFISIISVCIIVLFSAREDFGSIREDTLDVSSGTDVLKILNAAHMLSWQWSIVDDRCIGK